MNGCPYSYTLLWPSCGHPTPPGSFLEKTWANFALALLDLVACSFRIIMVLIPIALITAAFYFGL
jgi:hypothetical protein